MSHHSTAPARPYPDFPLFRHATGYWAKKIKGKTHYFGSWSDPDAALQKYLDQKDALHAGRKPREDAGELTVKDAANVFLNAKAALRDGGELSTRTWTDYARVCELLVKHFGKQRSVSDLDPADFAELRAKAAKQWGPTAYRPLSSTRDRCSSTPLNPDSFPRLSGSGRDSNGRARNHSTTPCGAGREAIHGGGDSQDDRAQLITEYQAHGGAVNTSTTPKVQYTYSEMAGGANHSRLTSII